MPTGTQLTNRFLKEAYMLYVCSPTNLSDGLLGSSMVQVKELMDSTTFVVGSDMSISQTIGFMLQHQIDEAIVTDNYVLLGMVDHNHLLKSRLMVHENKTSTCTHPVPKIYEHNTLQELATLFINADHSMLPVLDKDDKVIGSIHIIDLLKNITVETAAHTVWKQAISAPADTTVGQAIHLLHANKTNELLIIDQEHIAGIIQFIDILRRYYLVLDYRRDRALPPVSETKAFRAEDPDILKFPIQDLIERQPLMFNKTDSIAQVIALMEEGRRIFAYYQDNRLIKSIDAKSILEEYLKMHQEPSTLHIQYVHLDSVHLNSDTIEQLQQMIDHHAKKLQYLVHNELEVIVHPKVIRTEGERHQYTMHLRCTYPGDTISVKAEDWDILLATRDALHELEMIFKNKFDKQSSNHSHRYNPTAEGTRP